MPKIKRILVANRGEIACRIIRTARALGIDTVAVHSDADEGAPHVRLADDAARIGPAPVRESYLSIERLLDAARRTRADAVHPGYGFLSENAAFARACAEAGLTFIGPPAAAIEAMGNKAEAKRRMRQAGVPCVPGYDGPEQSDAALAQAADSIGYPIMVKAAAGGGGRGMRLVGSPEALVPALALARAEADSAFGSAELILEKAIVRPRHVEIQVFADAHGHVIHLGERDCSVQRRHQKIIEEAPCPILTEEVRREMGRAATLAARSIGYLGAGTVELLLDESGSFYFLEMNTRLQVEHPVTEMVTGLDLVALQIQVAEGRPLGIDQDDVVLEGHAIEARVYAEDPARGFLPATGLVERFTPPTTEGVRVDAGIQTGQEVSPHYDAMVAKIIAGGPTREIARRRLVAALERLVLFGPKTNQRFLIDCLDNPTFAERGATTAFLSEEMSEEATRARPPLAREIALAAVVRAVLEREASVASAVLCGRPLLGWSTSGPLSSTFRFLVDDARHDARVTSASPTRFLVRAQESEIEVELLDLTTDAVVVRADGERLHVPFLLERGGHLWVAFHGRAVLFRDIQALGREHGSATRGGQVVAPMHGVVREVLVSPGDVVTRGSRLAVLEAMKMQHEIEAPVAGVVREARAVVGAQTALGAVLFEIDQAGEPGAP
ncbi:MAG: acetyl-CoA carboxylase biotin carboxylase subunit [Myxococcales bacterium]|nr:acetyl-CoA carboxylase biotin carboxylase subunit [Myxococcales bacterium]